MTDRISRADEFAEKAHTGQVRKVRGGDYIDHPRAVRDLVAETGGTERAEVGALLHDVKEDCAVSLDTLTREFGAAVAEVVDYVSERRNEGHTYFERKRRYIDRLGSEGPNDSIHVALADKLHNAKTTLRDLRDGYDALDTFKSFFWYYAKLIEMFRARTDLTEGQRSLLEQIEATVDAIGEYRKAA